MRLFFAKIGYRLHLYLARRWADPALAELAERCGAVIVTAERFDSVVLPLYYAIPWIDGELVGRLASRIHELERRLQRHEP